jgi:cytochrome c
LGDPAQRTGREPGTRGIRVLGAVIALAVPGAAFAATVHAQEGDAAKGQLVYARCMACHALAENGVGPRHCGLFGRRAGSVPGFDYSPAMRRSKVVWSQATLDRFLRNPLKYIPGNAMTFAGVPDPKERADLIAWLRQATASPKYCNPPSH